MRKQGKQKTEMTRGNNRIDMISLLNDDNGVDLIFITMVEITTVIIIATNVITVTMTLTLAKC